MRWYWAMVVLCHSGAICRLDLVLGFWNDVSL